MPRRSLRIANLGKEVLQEYKYTPLENVNEWIRLLRFLPRPTGAPLSAEISHIKLCDAPPYRALSYTWGTSSDVHAEIELCTSLDLPTTTRFPGQVPGVLGLRDGDGNEHYFQRQRFRVRSSLEAPMRRLERLHGQSQFIWIDAICIDQSNDVEKGHQVSIMSHIYRSAVEIDIWLGEEDEEDESDLAMDLVINYETTCGCRTRPEDILGQYYEQCEAFENKTRNWTSHWRALGKLISRPWFTRRWIIQETAFAQQKYVHCGDKRVCWFSFIRVIPIYHKRYCNKDQINELHRHCLQIESLERVSEKVKRREEHHLTLIGLLREFHQSSCTDPRDAIYSLVSLARDIDPKKWLPDYSSKNSELMVFKKAFQHIVDTSRSLDVMCLSDKMPDELLTWLPKFAQALKCDCGNPSCFYYGCRRNSLTTFGQPLRDCVPRVYSASGSTIPKIRFSINELILYVIGYRVDTIKSTPPTGQQRCRSCDRATYADCWAGEDFDTSLDTCYVGKVREAYPRSLVGNRALRGSPGILEKMPDAWLGILEEAACFHDTCGCDVNGEAIDITNTISFVKGIRKVLAFTERSVGFVAEKAKEGDTICILLGCSVPVVLRPIGDSAFEFVGECYIDGLMEGESMHTASESAWEPEEIEIH